MRAVYGHTKLNNYDEKTFQSKRFFLLNSYPTIIFKNVHYYVKCCRPHCVAIVLLNVFGNVLSAFVINRFYMSLMKHKDVCSIVVK